MLPEFQQPIHNAQAVFRAVLRAFAYPALPIACPVLPNVPHAFLPPALAAVALVLLDLDTPLWLSPSLRQSSLASWLRFYRSVRIVDKRQEAMFALVAGPEELPCLDSFAQGTTKYPERSATIILGGLHFDEGCQKFRASGPGIDRRREFACDLPDQLVEQLAANTRRFQLGVDLLVSDGTNFAGLPRTTRLAAVKRRN